MKIAILGWGSLLWDKVPVFDNQHGEWREDGPVLKLEFSRISQKRLGALTLVIDEEHGTLIPVAWCLSKRVTLEDAMCDLCSREGTVWRYIGYADLSKPAASPNNDATKDIVKWARTKKLDYVVWTALSSNFKEDNGKGYQFFLNNAVSYVKTLLPEGKAKAAEYVWRAPAFIKTPLRTALQKEPWFADVGS